MKPSPLPTFFVNQQEFRKWLEQNHNKEKELLVGFYKVNSGKFNMSWSESVDQALCFGWIDGIRRSINDESYCIRFTPRNPRSIWSSVNIKKVEVLIKEGLMTPAGASIFNLRKESKSEIYSYENKPADFSEDFKKTFTSNIIAWEYFQTKPQSYRKTVTNWVMSAKQETTRIKRLNQLIEDCAQERKIKPMSY